jgi:predicted Zn-dependent peptidase
MSELRREQPPVIPVDRIEIPEIQQTKLDNDVPVYLIESGTEDVIRLEFTFNAGQIMERLPLLASTTNMMLKEGTEHYTSRELSRTLDFYGAFLHLLFEKDRAGLVIFCLSKHVDKILELCVEMLYHPVFPASELDILLKKRFQWYQINREKVQNVSIDKFFESIFGKDHPYGRVVNETDFSKINAANLTLFHADHYRLDDLAIIISGKIPAGITEKLNDRFGSMSQPLKVDIIDEPQLKGSEQKKIHIEKPGAVQSAIRIGSVTINKKHTDYQGLKVVDSILGGYFGSRLMKNIREEKGYTYGIRSSVSSLSESGYLLISTEVGNEYLENTLNEIYREITILQNELISLEELEIVRNYMSGELLRMFDGPFAVAESFRAAWEFGLDNDYYKRFLQKIKTIDPDEIKLLANRYYNIENLYEVTVGVR